YGDFPSCAFIVAVNAPGDRNYERMVCCDHVRNVGRAKADSGNPIGVGWTGSVAFADDDRCWSGHNVVVLIVYGDEIEGAGTMPRGCPFVTSRQIKSWNGCLSFTSM